MPSLSCMFPGPQRYQAEHSPWGMDPRAPILWLYPHNRHPDVGVYSHRSPGDVAEILSTTVGVPILALLHGKTKNQSCSQSIIQLK